MAGTSIIDRAIGAISPAWALGREKAKLKLAAARGIRNQYDGATHSRRSQGWRRTRTDANAELMSAASVLAMTARDMVRNNPYAERAVSAIATDIVGTGITFQVLGPDGKPHEALTALAKAHFETTACDADGRHNLYGLQLLAARCVVESGAVLARYRPRFSRDPVPVPFQIQMLEPDYLDAGRNGLLGAGSYVSGIEFDAIGNRRYYWLYPSHPGAIAAQGMIAMPVPAGDILHVYRQDRPGQQHGGSWFAPVIMSMREWADYQDGQLLRQKLASSYAVFRIGMEGEDGDAASTDESGQDFIEPGMITDLPTGADIKFASPPGVDGYAEFAKISIRTFATGLNVPYDIFGDLESVNFSSARIGRIPYNRQLDAWTWQMLIPQFCDGAGAWFLRAAALKGHDTEGCRFVWTPPRRELLDVSTEGPAIRDMVRSGMMTPSAAIRERGDNPETVFAEWARDKATFERLGLVFDCDPSQVTQVGNAVLQNQPGANATPPRRN